MIKYLRLIALTCLLGIFIPASGSERSIICTKDPSIDSLPDSHALIVGLKSIDLQSYSGQTVNSLLNILPGIVHDIKIANFKGGKKVDALAVRFAADTTVQLHIYVTNFQYINPNIVNTSTPTQNWDVHLFKQETISWAIVYNWPRCINGCIYELR